MKPAVTVVIPTYNRRHLLAEAIDSALSQRGAEVDVVVVDDGSTDGTVDWLHTAYADRPVQVLSNTGRKGPAGGRNTGMRAARGDLVALLDSDDRFRPGHLAQAVQAFQRFAELGLVFGRARYLRNGQPDDYMGPLFERKLASAPTAHRDEGLAVFAPEFFDHLLANGCWFNLSSVVLRRGLAVQGMNEGLRIAEDYEFWVRLAQHHRFGCLLAPQIDYLLHDANISFEADTSAAQHAPSQLAAFRSILDLPALTPRQRHLVRAQMSQVLADWAWRCRQHGQLRQAAALHLQGLPLGHRGQHLRSLLKLALFGLGAADPARG